MNPEAMPSANRRKETAVSQPLPGQPHVPWQDPAGRNPPSLPGRRRRLAAAGARLREILRGDAGYTTETVIVTALLAAAALTVLAILVAKITALAHSISL